MSSFRIHLKLLVIIFCLGTNTAIAMEKATIQLPGKDEAVILSIDIVNTPPEREQGLMNRTELAPDYGMLFDFRLEQPTAMWMKNTLIPLDMVFFNNKQEVVFIRRDAKPMSLEAIASPVPARYVLELAGGEASRYGIKKGQKFEWVNRPGQSEEKD